MLISSERLTTLEGKSGISYEINFANDWGGEGHTIMRTTLFLVLFYMVFTVRKPPLLEHKSTHTIIISSSSLWKL